MFYNYNIPNSKVVIPVKFKRYNIFPSRHLYVTSRVISNFDDEILLSV